MKQSVFLYGEINEMDLFYDAMRHRKVHTPKEGDKAYTMRSDDLYVYNAHYGVWHRENLVLEKWIGILESHRQSRQKAVAAH